MNTEKISKEKMSTEKMNTEKDKPKVLRGYLSYKDLYFYQKADAIYQLTYIFCQRFLSQYGDRTIDQMVQAARSGKQNIVEGIEAGNTSAETEIKLLNVARASLQELREDYEDFLHTRQLTIWTVEHVRYAALIGFCKINNRAAAYTAFAQKWTAEEFCNTLLTLCHMTDKMMCAYLVRKEQLFVEQGGIKERMYAARTGYRKEQEEKMRRLQEENNRLRAENMQLREKLGMIRVTRKD